MSAKVKFWSNSSTPIKKKLSENSSTSISPIKRSKYKSFLASVLTPSQTKKWLKRKKSNKSEKSSKESKIDVEEVYKSSQLSDDFSDPVYSSMQELPLKQSACQESVLDSSSAPSTKLSENMHEPVYSVIRKKAKDENTNPDIIYQGGSSHKQESNEKNLSEHLPSRPNENTDTFNKNLVEEQEEEIKLLVERMKELTTENIYLRKNIETIIKEEKWKEDSLHAELKLKITQLEADTHKEVKSLSDLIKTLLTERKVLTDQNHILHEEKKLLEVKYADACCKIRTMVSPEFMKKVTEKHEKSLNQSKKKHLDEIKKLQEENETTLESKISLMGEVGELRERVNLLISKHETVKNSEEELLQERNRILMQLEASKQMQQEAQNMLLSLLKTTETISIERDVLINKASFQNHQQKLLQTTIVDYSLNMGRLQEHISNFSREKLGELHKLKSGESQRDESLRNFYGRQLEMLRTKVLNQSNTINELESEKSKLELQLESLWQATCMRKPKAAEDATFNS